MCWPKLARMGKSGSVNEVSKSTQRAVMELAYADSLVRDDDSPLAPGVLRRDAGRTTIGVAGLCLHATEREHEAACRVAPVGAERKNTRHVETSDYTPAGAQANVVPQPGPDEAVARQHQPLAERSANMVDKFKRRGTGAALGAVDHNKVRTDFGFHHRLADGHEFPRVADAKLEADWLAVR